MTITLPSTLDIRPDITKVRAEASRNVMQLKATLAQVEMALAQSERLYSSLCEAEGIESALHQPRKQEQSGPASTVERQLVQLLLAEPELIGQSRLSIPVESIQHSGMRRILAELYSLQEFGKVIDLDAVRIRLLETELFHDLPKLQFIGQQMNDRADWLNRIIRWFSAQESQAKDALAMGADDQSALDLLAKLSKRKPRIE